MRKRFDGLAGILVCLGSLAVLLSGCVSEPVTLADDGSFEFEPLEPVWAQRLDAEYFEYELLEHLRLENPPSQTDPPATQTVTIPAGVAYLSVRLAFYSYDPSISLNGPWPSVTGEWSNGTRAFDIPAEYLCISNGTPGRYCGGDPVHGMTRSSTIGSDLVLTLNGWRDKLYVDVQLERAEPFPWDGGDPPYVKILDPEYFDLNETISFRLEFPQTPLADRPELQVEVPEGQEFLGFHVRFFHRHPVDSIWTGLVPYNQDNWPTVVGTWDDGKYSFVAKPDRWGFPLVVMPSQSDVPLQIVRVPDGAKTLDLSSKGWGGDTYAVIDMSHAHPVAPFG